MKIDLSKNFRVDKTEKGGLVFYRRESRNDPWVKVGKATKKAAHAMVWALKQTCYLPMDCPSCGRHRVEFDGVSMECEKCGWEPEAGTEDANGTPPSEVEISGDRLSCGGFSGTIRDWHYGLVFEIIVCSGYDGALWAQELNFEELGDLRRLLRAAACEIERRKSK